MSMPDISGFLGSADPGAPLPPAGGENPLTVPDYPEAEPMEGDEAAPADDVDPDFYAIASGIFPEWGPDDPRYAQLQELIDLRVNGGAAPVEPDEDDAEDFEA